jgi:hypothetical protein
VLAALAVLLTACASPVSGAAQPVDPVVPSVVDLPFVQEQRQLAELFAQVRTWDMCAMHDLGAASRATGFVPDELLPYRELGICRLVLKDQRGVEDWKLQVHVFPVIPTPGGAPIQVGGLTLEQVRDSDDMRCAYSLPIGFTGAAKPYGIEVSGTSISGVRPPCDVVREYVTAIAPRLQSPPLRGDGGTTPALPLSGNDPCALAAAMIPVLADGEPLGSDSVRVSELGPYDCGVTVFTGALPNREQSRASVALAVRSERDVSAGSLGGYPASLNELGIFCSVVFAPSGQLAGNPDVPASVPVVEVIGDCEQVEELAEVAVAELVLPQPAQPRENAQALGDLDPPPTPDGAGAPFDPCTVVGFADYPAAVQPGGPREPSPMPVGPDDPFATGCKFNAGEMFSSLVWGMPSGGFSADPAARTDGRPAQFGDRSGTEHLSTNESNGEPSCYSAVQLDRGIAAMSTTVPDDPCAVNRAVLEKLVQRVR